MSKELAVYGADIANQQAGANGSFFDDAVMLGGTAAVSGLAGIYNTFVDLGSLVGVDAEQIDVSRQLQMYDTNWYKYYKENKQLSDITGFVATSLIPGTLGIKGLKAVQAGNAGGAIGRAVSGPLNYANVKRNEYLAKGLKEIASEGGSAYAYTNANMLASISWGFAENFLQNAAFEVAVLASSYKSPIFADASKADILVDMGWGALFGAGIGGALDTITTNRIFKDTVQKLGREQRAFDTPSYFSRLGLNTGDEAAGFVDSLFNLPKEVLETKITVTNKFNKQELSFDITKQLENTLNSTQKHVIQEIQLAIKNFGTKEEPEAAQQLMEWVLGRVKAGQNAGADQAAIKKEITDHLFGMKSFKSLRDDAPLGPTDKNEVFYIADSVDLKKLAESGNSVDTFLQMATSRTPFAKNATAKPYRVVGDLNQLKLTASYSQFGDAWTAGYDVAVIGGKLRINPASNIIEQDIDPVLNPRRYFNTTTSAVSDDVVATWADALPPGARASKSIIPEGVLVDGKQALKFGADEIPDNAFMATARHAWASHLDLDYFLNHTVDVRDISLLERLRSFGADAHVTNDFKIKLRDGTKVSSADVDIDQLLLTEKLTRLKEIDTVNFGGDRREIAYLLNTNSAWLERALARGYQSSPELLEGMSRELTDYLKRENFVATWQSPRTLVEIGHTDVTTYTQAAAAARSKGAKYLDDFVTGDLGFYERVKLLQDNHKAAVAATMGGDFASRLIDLDMRNFRKIVDELGVGAGITSFSNANYGDLAKLWAQYTGQQTRQMIHKTATANLEKLQPFIRQMADDKQAGAELGIILNMLRGSSNKFVLIDDTAGIRSLVVKEVTDVDLSTGIRFINGAKLDDWASKNGGQKAVFNIESRKVGDFLETWRNIHGERIGKKSVIMNSRGLTSNWDPEVVYAPPVDTRRYPFFAFVKIKEGHIAGNSDVAIVTAKDAEQLTKLTNQIDNNKYDVFFKEDTAKYRRIKSEYDHQLSVNAPRLDSLLRKQNKLGDFFYETRPENVLEDFIRFSEAADTALVRQAVDTRYAQTFVELEALGEKYTKAATSQGTGASKIYDKSVVNPFGDYATTALDISKRSAYPIINSLNEWVDSAGTTAYKILVANTDKAKNGLLSWEEAEKIATRYGIGGAYNVDNAAEAYGLANRPGDRNLFRETISKVNMTLATVGLRLDFANTIVNTISMPIMLGTELASLKSLAKTNPEAIGALKHLTTISPDGTVAVPSYTKLIGDAINNIMGKDGKALLESYRASGDIRDVTLQFYDMLGELAINPRSPVKDWKKVVDAAVEKGAKWTGNTWSEDFTRALSANVMDQLTAPLVAAKLLSSAEAAAYRSVFVNRVNGNYIASQRPILFQGTVGAAVSLFQTYMFNVMQQLTRHIENRDMRALLTMGGLQGFIYGFNGLPFFEAVNTHLIGNANINDGHRDIYSTTTQLAGKEWGDFLLYGTASALPLFGEKSPAFYTRGDLNPRHVTVIPTSVQDIPAVSVTLRVAKNLQDMGSKFVGGADVSATLLEGLEHNGVSRPLAGFAQWAQGHVTTSKGSLVSANNDMLSISNSLRMLGTKPMDEAVLLNTMYRQQAYKAADLERLAKLGEIVKTKLRANQTPTDEELFDFMKRYAAAGGNLQNYSAALNRWSKDANMSIVNQMKQKHNSSYAQRLAEIMAGSTLEDYYSAAQQTMDQ